MNFFCDEDLLCTLSSIHKHLWQLHSLVVVCGMLEIIFKAYIKLCKSGIRMLCIDVGILFIWSIYFYRLYCIEAKCETNEDQLYWLLFSLLSFLNEKSRLLRWPCLVCEWDCAHVSMSVLECECMVCSWLSVWVCVYAHAHVHNTIFYFWNSYLFFSKSGMHIMLLGATPTFCFLISCSQC